MHTTIEQIHISMKVILKKMFLASFKFLDFLSSMNTVETETENHINS